MEINNALKNFGLTEAEIKIYLMLLKSGESKAGEIAQITSSNRTFTYDRLKKLKDAGLVSTTIKDNKKYFLAVNPEYLLELAKQREEAIHSILPELQKIVGKKELTAKVEVFSTKKGVKTAINSSLKAKKELLIIGTISPFEKTMQEHFGIWNARRISAKIQTKAIISDNFIIPNAECRKMEGQTNTTTLIFDETTIITIWSENPVAILITDKNIAENYKTLFKNQWEMELKVYEGAEGVKKAFDEMIEDEKESMYGYGMSWKLATIYGIEYGKKWQESRISKGIIMKEIVYDETASRKYFGPRPNLFASKKAPMEIRYLDQILCGPAAVFVSKNYAITFLYTEKDKKVIVSKNKETINIYKKHFEALWKISKE
jgi:sugar-specific transcriptional regulator TrmB